MYCLFDINLVNFNKLVRKDDMYMFSSVSLQICLDSSPLWRPLLNYTETRRVVTHDLYTASAVHSSQCSSGVTY